LSFGVRRGILRLAITASVGPTAILPFVACASPGRRSAQDDNNVTTRATGSFDVKITPLATDTPAEGSPLGRMSIDKTFHGDLEATSTGEMLTVGTAIKNSAGYVAIERVTGSLHGKAGTFALQHNATMTRGTGALNIIVVPDSGTGELAGLSGSLSIEITGGRHAYVLEYALD
jgi:Protein of unknown function (DUF3224)